MSSTLRGYNRHKSDYYITPKNDIKLFLNRFLEKNKIDLERINILDPCAGGDKKNEMSYPSILKMYNPISIKTIDIREDSRAELIADFLKVEPKQKFDLIITNPPFGIAQEIIEHSFNFVNNSGYIVILQRLNFLGSKKRFAFWEKNKPYQIYVHHKRMSFTENGATDSIEYAHFVWKKGFSGDTTLHLI